MILKKSQRVSHIRVNLGPLLFIIFINDMFMHDSSVDNKSSLYADDSSFYTVGNTYCSRNWDKLESRLEESYRLVHKKQNVY